MENVLLNLLETSSAVVSCCLAITTMSNQLTTCKQLIGKEGNPELEVWYTYCILQIVRGGKVLRFSRISW